MSKRPTASGQPLRLVIMGEQRSGTTLVARWLDAQDGVTVRSGYLGRLTHLASVQLGLGARAPLGPRAQHVLFHAARVERDLVEGDRTLPFRAEDLRTFSDLHRRMLELGAEPGGRVVGHKIHGPLDALLDLLEEPDVRGMYFVRDVRDVMLSRWFRGERIVDEPLLGWRRSVRRVLGCTSPRLALVRFEDLVLTPGDVASRLGRLLGVDLTSRPAGLLDDAGRPTSQNTSYDDLAQALDPAAVGRWRSRAGHPVVRYAQLVCRAELARLGYEVPGEPAYSLRERLRFGRRVATVRLLELPRRAKDAWVRRVLPTLGDDL